MVVPDTTKEWRTEQRSVRVSCTSCTELVRVARGERGDREMIRPIHDHLLIINQITTLFPPIRHQVSAYRSSFSPASSRLNWVCVVAGAFFARGYPLSRQLPPPPHRSPTHLFIEGLL